MTSRLYYWPDSRPTGSNPESHKFIGQVLVNAVTGEVSYAYSDGTLQPMNGRQAVGLALVLAGVASGILWMSGRAPHPYALVVALLLSMSGASVFISRVRGLAEKMRPLLGKNVRVQAWGSDLPGNLGSMFGLCAVRAVGPGLHVYLRPLPDGSPAHLKVAQPSRTTISDAGLEIGEARYVQWAGSKISKVEGKIALVLVVTGRSLGREASSA